MKQVITLITIFRLVIAIGAAFPDTEAQVQLHSLQMDAGATSFSANTPAIKGFLWGAHAAFRIAGRNDFLLEAGYMYTRNLDILLPEIRTGKYYGYIHGPHLTALIEQNLTPTFFLKEGLGIVYLQDRTLPDNSQYSPGILLKISAGFYLSSVNNYHGSFFISAGTSAAVTLLNTTPGFYAAYISLGYTL